MEDRNQVQKRPTVVLGIIHKDDQVVIIKRKEKDDLVKDLIWAFPGGKLHSDETPEQSLIREIQEEVGLNIRIRGLLFVRVYPGTQILQRFYDCELVGSPKPQINEPDEVEEVRWVKAASVQEYFASNVHPFILGFLNGLSSKNPEQKNPKIEA